MRSVIALDRIGDLFDSEAMPIEVDADSVETVLVVVLVVRLMTR